MKLRRAGTAAVEFALIAPFVAIVLLGLTDWGLAIEQRERLQTAVRAGAQIALYRPDDTTAIQSAVTAAVSGLSGVTATSSGRFCTCDGAAMTSCNDSCSGAFAGYVTVRASRAYSRLTPTGPTTVSANVTVRVN